MTAADIVIEALRALEVLGAGATPSTDEAADGLKVLQRLLANWTAEELTIFATNTQAVSLTTSTVSYTLSTRPTKILSADVLTGSLIFPVEVCGPVRWAELDGKNDTSARTKALYCDYAYTSASIQVAPKPAGSATLNLYCLTDLSTLASGAATFSMPSGYERAVVFNLAVDLSTQFGREVPATVAAIATQSKQALQALNTSNREGVGVRQLNNGAAAQ